MSDFGDGSDYGYYSGEDEWLYVEDHYDEATKDNLAEHTLPSPVVHAVDDAAYDYDEFYDYWDDLNYLSDSYYDQDAGAKEGMQRKRKTAVGPTSSRKKKRKISKADATTVPAVIWKTQAERTKFREAVEIVQPDTAVKVALFGDWRARFRDVRGFSSGSNGRHGTQDHVEREALSAEGFDLSDMNSVAEMLSGENMTALKEILKARGLDADAVDMVLQDMLAGNERTFEENTEMADTDQEDEEQGEEDLGKPLTPNKLIERGGSEGIPALLQSPGREELGRSGSKKRKNDVSEATTAGRISGLEQRSTIRNTPPGAKSISESDPHIFRESASPSRTKSARKRARADSTDNQFDTMGREGSTQRQTRNSKRIASKVHGR